MRARTSHWSLMPCVLALLAGCGGSADTGPARDTITVESLRSDIELLSSDEYLGRGTGEKGADLAAAHIQAVFSGAGLVPIVGQDDLIVPYDLYASGWASDSALQLELPGGETTADLGVDYRPFRFSDAGTAEGDLVFAGYGITAPDLGWDDYDGLDVTDKIVVLLRHDPGETHEDDDDDAPSEWDGHGGHALFTSKARNAAEHGAVGMILITDPLNHVGLDDLRATGRLSLEPSERRPDQDADEPFLAVHASRRVGEALIAATGRDLSSLQKALNAGEKVNCDLPGSRARVALSRAEAPEKIHAANVVAMLPGTDPELRDELVVLGAHYDHLGAIPGPSGDADSVYNGADDNASGTAGLLALARAFSALPENSRPKRSVVFAAFSGEEKGLLGSESLLESGVLDPDRIAVMLNFDMIGRSDAGGLQVIGDGYATGMRSAIEEANADLGLDIDFAGSGYTGSSDHHTFKEADVPFVHFFTGLHDDYHQLSDHADKLDVPYTSRIVQLAFGLATDVASGERTPRFIHHVNWLGVQVEFRDTDAGTRATITRVEPDSRAQSAGFQAGDLIYGFNEARLEDPAKVGEQFRSLQPGQSMRITVDRANSRFTFPVERAKTGYLGVWPTDLTPEFRAEHGLNDEDGVLLRSVMEDSPAAKAGLRDGDALLTLQGVSTTLKTLSKTLTRIGAGETVPIVILRDGERMQLTMTLGERPERP